MSPHDESLARTLGDVLTEHLMRERAVGVPGLGTFRVVHRDSAIEDEGGEPVMMPPSDTITFEEA